MSKLDKTHNQIDEEANKKRLAFINDCFSKLVRFQLDNNCILVPFLSGPWMRGVFEMSGEITFREMQPEERKMFEDQLAKQAGIDLSTSFDIKPK